MGQMHPVLCIGYLVKRTPITTRHYAIYHYTTVAEKDTAVAAQAAVGRPKAAFGRPSAAAGPSRGSAAPANLFEKLFSSLRLVN